ncbi:MAG: iron-sulfur cluster-binding protein [Bacteroidales bacterium]|nr:iron-sulfur cluster-binding protein [Bacteroidales bacterium]MCF8387168.1 iron-sulfur cluster-binding protein [Bacteroidales bacterium]MCF8397660.1 iron-sulfur cluster-binding protein [Bacteroidales bacterium]
MNNISRKFTADAEKKGFDPVHRKTIKYNMSRYDRAVDDGMKQFENLELARQRAAYLKYKIINDLEDQLREFESNFKANGGKIIWATDAKDAIKGILKVLQKQNAKSVVKSKSMTTEEIEMNEALEKQNIESLETDLGEYIVQIAGEKPYHIVTPAMHKSKEDIASLFHEKFKLDKDSSPEEITGYVRNILREKFKKADVGITGCNFLVSDTGSVCITENEGNAMMSMSFPKVHIAVAGIEKLIPSLEHLDLFWPLLAGHGTGQHITVYNSIVNGPKKSNEADGPDEMYLVLLDNKRSELLKQEKQRIALSCIRCGACLNACPVYRNIGGHAYATTYSGPIGSVISPWLFGMKNYKHLSFASSLCGKCTEVCPVKIPLHELLLRNRNDAVKKGAYEFSEKVIMFGWKQSLLNRKMLDMSGGKFKNFILKRAFSKTWGPRRTLPKMQSKSFSQQWKEKERRKK